MAESHDRRTTKQARDSSPAGNRDKPRKNGVGPQPWTGVAFVTPALLVIGLVLTFPIIYGVYRSLFQIQLGMPVEFVGFENYAELLSDRNTWDSVWRSLILVAGCVMLGQFLAIMFALSLREAVRGFRFLRGLSLMPYLVSSIGTAVLFRILFNSDFGLPAQFISLFGGDPVTFLGDPTRAMMVIIIAQVWSDLPLSTLLVLGGLQTIDPDILNASRVDGANVLQRVRFVFLPLIKPQLFLSAVFLSYHSLTGLGVILGLTGGGPGRATQTMAVNLYEKAFVELNQGSALALVIVVLILNALLTLVYMRVSRDDVS